MAFYDIDLEKKFVFSADKQARFGCKGKQKFWFGYKGHGGVDMRSGFIEKAAVTPANVSE